MKNVRNWSISLLTFLAILLLGLFACQKEQLYPKVQQATNNIETRSACPAPSFPTIASTMMGRDSKGLRLFDYRYGVSLYRYFVKIYGNFSIRLNKAGLPLTISTADLNTWGVSEILSVMDVSKIDGIMRTRFFNRKGSYSAKNCYFE